ncbi:MAG: DNA-binding MarR family transcriptional regulator [Bacteroidia bacterium]|jgi:DNA-binding MarR family transcriptional regulator
MGIEHDIKQKAFQTEYQKVFINVAYTNSYLTTMMNTFLKKYDVSMQQYNVLRIARGQHPNPTTVSMITDRMIDKMSNASRLVDKLQLKELLERKQCSSDKRQVDVHITTRGLELLNEIDQFMSEFEAQLSHVSLERAALLNDILDEIRNNINTKTEWKKET